MENETNPKSFGFFATCFNFLNDAEGVGWMLARKFLL